MDSLRQNVISFESPVSCRDDLVIPMRIDNPSLERKRLTDPKPGWSTVGTLQSGAIIATIRVSV